MNSVIQTEQFKELEEQIFDRKKWDKNRFKVFSYEAGAGKSRAVHEYLSKVSEKALYVQRFSKDGALEETAMRINSFAGRKKAIAYSSSDSKKVLKEAIDIDVVCITHQRYKSLCKKDELGLAKGRKILIIDEFIDLIDRVNLNSEDIGKIWSEFYGFGRKETDCLAHELREMLNEMLNSQRKDMVYMKMPHVERYTGLIEDLIKITDVTGTKIQKELLFKLSQLFKTGWYFYEGEFQTFDARNKFKLLECNIILDANEDDYRYNLSDIFDLRKQPKLLDYSTANFYHVDIGTNKKELSTYINLYEKILNKIEFVGSKGVLFITEKGQVEVVKTAIEDHFDENFESIQKRLGIPISIDYFGNLIGKNTYRLYDCVVVLKTPIFNFGAYALNKFFFLYNEGVTEFSDIELFKDDVVDEIKSSVTSGEIYQGIRRISRNKDTLDGSKIYVLNNNPAIIERLLKQLPEIRYNQITLEVNRTGKGSKSKGDKKSDAQVEELKNILMDFKSKGILSISKKDVRNQLGLTQASNFGCFLGKINLFLKENNITVENKIFKFNE